MKSLLLILIAGSNLFPEAVAFSSRINDLQFQRKKLTFSSSALQKSLYFAEELKTSDASQTVNGENGTAMDVSVYEKLGINEPDLALGINADELLQYVGTRNDLIEKCMLDLKEIDRDRATKEVDKFLMDSEMVNTLIAFNKRYPNGITDDYKSGNIWRTYANWLFSGAILIYVKNTIIMPKIESGEWKLPFGLFESSSDVSGLI
jgi:hypothetical protein